MPSPNWFKKAVDWTKGLLNTSGISQYEPILQKVNAFESSIQALSDEALAEKTNAFKQRIADGVSLDEILPEAFAVVRETGRRVLNMRHYDVQVLGGIALHYGNVAEMRTGEGKTLVATLPAYLNALTGKGVHVVTVNDYLAARDAEWMGQIYTFLGLSVGIVLEEMGHTEEEETRRKQEAYGSDITYGTNSTMVFDYLRDNLATSPEGRVHRNYFFAIVDEVDLLLIDEVRTPLIISGPSRDNSKRFTQVDKVIRKLQPGVHYRADWKTKTASLTEEGWSKTETQLNAGSLHSLENLALYNAVYQSVLAHCVYQKDVDYIVKDGQVQLVDEHTGHVSPDKRYSDGLHQAIEAKEGIRVRPEDRTFARTSYQGYFRLYEKLSGMTGTASTEKSEFRDVYGMRVLPIPTNRPNQRQDYNDSIFATMEDKHEIIANEVRELQAEGRPVLIGTCNVRESEQIGRMLKKLKIKANVLNAKNHTKEAEIIAQAGRKNAVTVSTNMAGRGTDILLGGDPEKLAAQKAKPGTPQYKKALARYEELCAREKEEVIEVGGLHVIGTSLHEAERLDNQLRGRAGRQGDPGSSQFIISLEDAIFRRYGEADIEWMLAQYDQGELEEIVDASVRKKLQYLREKVKVEYKFERTETFKYDQVIDQQRQHIYGWRNGILDSLRDTESAEKKSFDILWESLNELLDEIIEAPDFLYSDEGAEDIEDALYNVFSHEFEVGDLTQGDVAQKLPHTLFGTLSTLREERSKKIDNSVLCAFELELLLQIIDEFWIDHLTAIEELEDRVNLMGYAQLDPYVIFKTEVASMFGQLLIQIKRRAVHLWFALEIQAPTTSKKRKKKPSSKKRRT